MTQKRMLVALYRANPLAFSGKNMNRELGQQLGEEVGRMMLENLTADQRLLSAKARAEWLDPDREPLRPPRRGDC